MAESDVLELPDTSNADDIQEFIRVQLPPVQDRRGVKTLKRSLQQYLTLRSYAEKHLQRAYRNLATVNGVRTSTQRTGDKSRSLRRTAEKFYNDQTTQGLRQYCTMFGMTFESFESIEDVVEALVEHHLKIQQGEL